MESVINSEVRQLCKAVSEEQDSERLKTLIEKLTEILDERMLVASLI
jgi:hypothetical protein